MADQPHNETPTLHDGRDLADAKATVILVHGRGATADSILRLAATLDPDDSLPIAWLAPQAPGNQWYPLRFMEPLDAHGQDRTDALARIDALVREARAAGIPPERIGVIGFSQGACLALEYAGWGKERVGFAGALSGGVMGPLDDDRAVDGDRTGLDVFIGCGDRDDHIPLAHAERSARLFVDAGATVDYRAYPGMPHTINDDEITALQTAVTRLVGTGHNPPDVNQEATN